MKLNKTLMIAALVASSIFAADYAVRAQDSTNTPAAGARPPGGPGARGGRMNFDNIATQLELTDDQKTKAKPIFTEMMQKMQDLRSDTSLDQAGRRTKMKDIRDDANTKLKEVLTDEQYTKWQKMSQGRRPAGGPGAAPAATAPATPPATTPPQQ
jgi:protein CpxP